MRALKDRDEAARRAAAADAKRKWRQNVKRRELAALRDRLQAAAELHALIAAGEHMAAWTMACERVSSLARMIGVRE